MALRSFAEVAVHFGSFRNVDLFHQGLYHVRCRLFQGTGCDVADHSSADAASDFFAVPRRGPVAHEGAALPLRRLVIPAGLVDSEAAFRTRTFLIRYCEEEIDLNDVALFRLELDDAGATAATIEVRLMFADVSKLGGVERFCGESPAPLSESVHFKEVSSHLVRLHNILQNAHAYSPVVFDEFHFCRVDMMVHSALVDFRLETDFSGMPPAPVKRPAESAKQNGHGGLNGYALRSGARRPGVQVRELSESDGDLEAGPLSVRTAVAACGARRGCGCTDRGGVADLADAGPPQPSLEEVLLELATHTAATSTVDSVKVFAQGKERAADDAQGPLGACTLDLAEAADRLQREYVGRLVAVRAELGAQFEALQRPHAGSSQRHWEADVIVLSDLRLPGTSASAASPGNAGAAEPVPLSQRLLASMGDSPAGRSLSGLTGAMVVRMLHQDLDFVADQVLQAWQALLTLAVRSPVNALLFLRHEWYQQMRRHWSQSLFQTVLPTSTMCYPDDPEAWEAHARLAAALRRSGQYRGLVAHRLDDLSISVPPAVHTVFFDQRYADFDSDEGDDGGLGQDVYQGYVRHGPPKPLRLTTDGAGKRPRGSHVIVLVHGFQGQAFDMRLLKNNLALLYPKATYLCSSANEKDTEVDIQQMGANLAAEVRSFLEDWCPGAPDPALGRLSFVAHSIGGLVVRSALSLLQDFAEQMYTFLTFSSPHLGYVYAPTTLFQTGLWLVKKLKRSRCLEQLTMTDTKSPGESFLSRLSSAPGLENFRHVVLASSYQDQYAPYESARMEMSIQAEGDSRFGAVYRTMVENLTQRLRPSQLLRLDINFHMPEANLDTMIGRAAHIQFIESQSFMRMFTHMYGFLFE